jgi:hypothetical protein
VRGNAMQVYEKYVNLARDATSAGDRIAAESYHQYAEHYFRIINDTTDPQRPAPPPTVSGPAVSGPAVSGPAVSGPAVSGPAVSEPAVSEPAVSEPAGSEPAEAEQSAAESAGPERQKGGRQPYPMDAEQPFVDGAAKAAASIAASTAASTAASEGNGQAPKAKPATEEDGEPPVADGDAKTAPVEEAKAKPRGRGRPRTRAKAGNGAAAVDGEAEGAVTPASGEPCKAGESSS